MKELGGEDMIGLTRGPVTLLAAGAAGLLVWFATQIDDSSTGGFWAVYGLLAGAGLVMALSQLIGGWTKWGPPRFSLMVFLIAFVPALVCVGWIALASQPQGNWFQGHIQAWSGDIHVRGLVGDLKEYLSALAFGLGLMFGLTLDTAAPAAAPETTEAAPTRERPFPTREEEEDREARLADRRGRRPVRIPSR
jgi:hypothetical protein